MHALISITPFLFIPHIQTSSTQEREREIKKQKNNNKGQMHEFTGTCHYLFIMAFHVYNFFKTWNWAENRKIKEKYSSYEQQRTHTHNQRSKRGNAYLKSVSVCLMWWFWMWIFIKTTFHIPIRLHFHFIYTHTYTHTVDYEKI